MRGARAVVMSLESLEKAADDCFTQPMRLVRSRVEHEAAIDVWNKLLDPLNGLTLFRSC